jgi:hypothetical protein
VTPGEVIPKTLLKKWFLFWTIRGARAVLYEEAGAKKKKRK